jgi:hypothetical protein
MNAVPWNRATNSPSSLVTCTVQVEIRLLRDTSVASAYRTPERVAFRKERLVLMATHGFRELGCEDEPYPHACCVGRTQCTWSPAAPGIRYDREGKDWSAFVHEHRWPELPLPGTPSGR